MIGEISLRNKKNIFDIYENLYCYNNLKPSNIIASQVTPCTGTGYLELFVFTDRGTVPIEGAKVTIFAKKDEGNSAPLMTLYTETKPLVIELPVANPLGTLIQGPEYCFSTYNMLIEKDGYYSINVLNIRLFPGIKAQFNYNLNSVMPGVPYKQETIAIPPHPRDIVIL